MPVLVYRNAHVALPWFDLQAAAMANESMPADMWVRNASGQLCRGSLGPSGATGLFYNLSAAGGLGWFLGELVAEAAGESSAVDGVFFDEVDWATCGFLQAECGPFSAAQVAALWDAQAAAQAAAAAALAARGKYAVQSLFAALRSNGGAIDGRPCARPEDDWLQAAGHGFLRFYGDLGWFGPAATASDCDRYLQNMVDESALQLPRVVRGVLPANATSEDVESLVAAALMSLAEYTYVGVSTGWGDADWRWWPVFDRDFGQALGPARRQAHAWTRSFSTVVATYDCSTRQGKLAWHTHDVD